MTETAGLGTLALLEQAGQITATSLALDGMDFDAWSNMGAFLGEVKNRASWYLGDWVNYGEGEFGERHAQAVERTGLRHHTLSNYAWTCRRVSASRRREDLSFSHHSVVAALTPAEQRHWLNEAATKGWARQELEDAVRRARNPESVLPPDPQPNPTARQIVDAGRSMTVIRDALEKAAETVDVGPAIAELEQAAGTIKAAVAAAPAAWQAAHELVTRAVPHGEDHYLVRRENLDELRKLVMDEGGTE